MIFAVEDNRWKLCYRAVDTIYLMKAIINKEQKTLTQADILRKLQKSGVDSSQEYELIIHNLQEQNIRLLRDREELKMRVDLLKEKQKSLLEEQLKPKKRNPTIDYKRLKHELDRRYKDFQKWQKKCYNSMNKNAFTVHERQYVNECHVIDNEIKNQQQILTDQKKAFKRLQKAIKAELKDMNRNVPQREVLEEQNRELRRQIWNLRIVEDLTGHVEVRVQNNMVGLQNKKRFIQKLKTMTVEEIKREEVKTKMNIINHDVRLKNQQDVINQRQRRIQSRERLKTFSSDSNSKTKFASSNIGDSLIKRSNKVGEKQKMIQSLQVQLATIQTKKAQISENAERIKIRLKQQQQKLQKRAREAKQLEEREYEDVCLQVNMFEDQNPLRREIIGLETEFLQDDRLMLKGMKDLEIVGLMVHESTHGIASLMALYSNGKHTPTLVPEAYLSKNCKTKKLIFNDRKDHVKWIKAYHDKTKNQVQRIQIYSHNKIRFEIGKKKQELSKIDQTPFKFDNLANQIPVCLRTSYQRSGQDWLLASFGVEFNTK